MMNDTAKYDGVSVIYKLDSNGNVICSSIIPIGTWGGFIPVVASDTSGNYVYLSGVAQSVSVFGEDTVNPFAVPGGHPFTVNGFPFAARWQECDSNVLYAGVNELRAKSEEVRVYPNPSNGVFQLEIRNYELGINNTVEVYNMLGERVYTSTQPPPNGGGASVSYLINLSSEPNGVYFYRVLSESGGLIGSGKMVIEK